MNTVSIAIGRVLLAVFSTMVVVTDVFIGRERIRQVRAASFATSSGRVSGTEIATRPSRKGAATCDVKVHYENRPVSAGSGVPTLLGRENRAAGSAQAADAIVRPVPADMEVTAYYGPAGPVEAGISARDFHVMRFLTPIKVGSSCPSLLPPAWERWLGVRSRHAATP